MALSRDELEEIRSKVTPDLPIELVLSIYQQESGSGANSKTSSRGAEGGFQVTKVAARDVGHPDVDLKNDTINAVVGMKYLNKQYQEAGKDPFAAAARYFGGPDAMSNLSITDGRVSRGDYATQVVSRMRSLGGSTMSQSNELISEPPGSEKPKAVPSIAEGSFAEEMMSAFGVSKRANQSASEAITEAIKVNNSETAAMTAGVTDVGALQSQAIMDRAMQTHARTGAAAKNAATAGIAKDDVNSLFSSLVAEYNLETDRTIQIKEAIRERGDIGLLDDPIAFLNAHLVEIPYLTKLHNQTVDLAVDKYNKLDSLNNIVQKQNVTDAAQIADISLSGAAAEAKVAALNAGINAAKLTAANSVQIAQLSVNQASVVGKELNELQQMQNMELQRIQKQYSQLLLDEKLDTIRGDKEKKALWEKDLAALGWTDAQFKGANKATQTSIATVIATGRLGEDPLEAITNAKNIPGLKLTPGQGIILQRFVDIYQNSGIDADKTLPKKEDKMNAGNAKIKEQFKQDLQNPNSGVDNPYKAAHPSVMKEVIRESKDFSEPFKNAIFTIGQTTLGTPVDDLVVVQAAVNTIGQNGYTREQAIKDLSLYYETAVRYNNSGKRFKDFGLPEQVKYPVTSDFFRGGTSLSLPDETKDFKSIGGLMGKRLYADLANPTAVSGLVTFYQAKKMTAKEGMSPAELQIFNQ